MTRGGVAIIDLPLCPFIREANYAIRAPWVLPDRRLFDYLLVVVERGTCRFTVEDRPYLLGPGQIFLVQPGERLTLEGLTDTVTPYVHCDIVDQPGREERFSPGPGFLDLTPHRHLVQPRLNDLLHETLPSIVNPPDPLAFRDQLVTCIGLWQTGTALNRMEAHALLATLLVKILRAHLADEPIKQQVPSSLQVLDIYLRQRVHDQITVQMMADHVGFSVPHLTRLCRLHWHQAPHQRLLRLRLEHALLLLHNVDLSIVQIARYCGFADTQHFVHVFRKHFGSTPTQARLEASSGLSGPVRVAPDSVDASRPARGCVAWSVVGVVSQRYRDGRAGGDPQESAPTIQQPNVKQLTMKQSNVKQQDRWRQLAGQEEDTDEQQQIVGAATPGRDS